MGKIFCVEFQREPLKFHTKYHTHTLNDMILFEILKAFKSNTAFFNTPPHTPVLKTTLHIDRLHEISEEGLV